MNSSFRARCSDQQLLLRRNYQTCKALRPGIEPDLRASKAHVATTRRREFSTIERVSCGSRTHLAGLEVQTPLPLGQGHEICGSLKGEV